MPKLLILEPCVVNFSDDRGGVHQSAGDLPDVPKESARNLIAAGRALYANKTDDPDKQGRNTASREMLQAAEAMAKPARKSPIASPPAAPDPAATIA